jgi:DnaA family protein
MQQQLLLEIIPSAPPSLENTVTGDNAEAIAAASNLQPGRALYLWGPSGCGRSHLLRALAAAGTGHFFDVSSSAAALWAAATDNSDSRGAKRLILVDDIHAMDDLQQSAVFALYNRWRELASAKAAFALIVSGDRAPLMMDLREDLRTRLGWDLVYRLDPLSDEDKLSALAKHAQLIGLPLSNDVLQWMFTHYARDIRQLFALVDALDRYSLSKHRNITVPLLRAMLSDRDFLQS